MAWPSGSCQGGPTRVTLERVERDGAPTSKWRIPKSEDLSGPAPSGLLKVRRPDLPEVEVKITDGMIIGRSAALADLVLDDDLVSRKHAQLHIDPRGYFRLEDLESRNGLRFHDRTVRRLNLVSGDVFYIGKTELEFQSQMHRLPPQTEPEPVVVDPLLADEAISVPEPEPDPAADLDAHDQLDWARRGRPDVEPTDDPSDPESA
ncbi:MAG: FHA domain-containing protein [Myxococcota bacterium]